MLPAHDGRGACPEVWAHLRAYVLPGVLQSTLILALAVVISLVYLLHDPAEGPSGSTWLGYGLGTAGAALIVWLSWLGVRKRSFTTARGPIQGWLSAHVYLGLLLLLVAAAGPIGSRNDLHG